MGTISGFMSADHDRLDAIFAEFQKEPDARKAQGLFSRFGAGLRAHIAWEEELLFPPFEEKTGMRDAGPTAVMRMEHRQIKQFLEAIGEALGKSDPGESVRALLEVLAAHNHKEEHILYPLLDQALSEDEASALLGRIEESRVNAQKEMPR